MRKFLEYMDRRMRVNFTFWDYGFLKIYGALFGLVLGAFFPEFVIAYVWIFVGIFVVLMFRFLFLLFFKKSDKPVFNS